VIPDTGPVFHKFLTPGPKEKHRILPESTPDTWSLVAWAKKQLFRPMFKGEAIALKKVLVFWKQMYGIEESRPTVATSPVVLR